MQKIQFHKHIVSDVVSASILCKMPKSQMKNSFKSGIVGAFTYTNWSLIYEDVKRND